VRGAGSAPPLQAQPGSARAGAINAVSAALVAHIGAIARIAAEHEPDWTLANLEVDAHDWCGETCPPVRALLRSHHIAARLERGELRGWTHTWLVLADGSILDPTISQFDRPGSEYTVDTDIEVHWLRSPDGARVALVTPGTALHDDYRPLPPRR
jgi:hypothetical protein